MYERILDERQVARDIVDAIRSTTDAPLHTCIDAARTCIAVMAPFIQDESFIRIQKAVREYVVSVNDCYDYRLLSQMKHQLDQLFSEKDELSFSNEQDDNTLIKYLHAFSECVTKTDPGVVMELITTDDFEWLNHLITVYQMDQNDGVRFEGLCCIVSLVDACPSLIPFLLNSRLPEVLALQFQSHDTVLPNLHLIAIKLLTRIYSTDRPPPLSHFEFFDANFFMKLLTHLVECPSEILDFIVNFSFLFPEDYDNAVIIALESNPNPLLGQRLVKVVNEETTDRRLKFFIDIAQRNELYRELFYENDLHVLSHVVARELINSETVEIRSRCMDCIYRLAEIGHCDRMVREAVENCDLDESSRSRTLAIIMSHLSDS